SFELLKRIYRISDETYQKNLNMMSEILGIDRIIDVPVRQLSLGQRMKGELTAAVLHSPSILFLDEPTIGLDVESKHAVRDFILEINRKARTTVVLTTHDLDDVQKLCKRLIVVSGGKVVQDGPLHSIVDTLAPFRILELHLDQVVVDVQHPKAEVLHHDGAYLSYRFDRNRVSASELITDLSNRMSIQDLKVKEPDIEEAIRALYRATPIT
ncbi:MAG TPA: AAA family ATPase, partial [Bacilli bacterium]